MKQLLVSSQVQASLMREILMHEIREGYWKDGRPAGHGDKWEGVEVVVSTTDQLGPVGFESPRLYNFVNPDFLKPAEDRVVECAKRAKPSSNLRSVKKELLELAHIIGGRLASKSGEPTKLNRGQDKRAALAGAVARARKAVDAAGSSVKRTAVKRPDGSTVRRVPAVHALPVPTETPDE